MKVLDFYRKGVEIFLGSILRHERDKDGSNKSKSILGAENGAISPAAFVRSGPVHDERNHEWAQCISQSRQAGQKTSKGEGCNLFQGKLDQLGIFGIVCRVELTSPM